MKDFLRKYWLWGTLILAVLIVFFIINPFLADILIIIVVIAVIINSSRQPFFRQKSTFRTVLSVFGYLIWSAIYLGLIYSVLNSHTDSPIAAFFVLFVLLSGSLIPTTTLFLNIKSRLLSSNAFILIATYVGVFVLVNAIPIVIYYSADTVNAYIQSQKFENNLQFSKTDKKVAIDKFKDFEIIFEKNDTNSNELYYFDKSKLKIESLGLNLDEFAEPDNSSFFIDHAVFSKDSNFLALDHNDKIIVISRDYVLSIDFPHHSHLAFSPDDKALFIKYYRSNSFKSYVHIAQYDLVQNKFIFYPEEEFNQYTKSTFGYDDVFYSINAYSDNYPDLMYQIYPLPMISVSNYSDYDNNYFCNAYRFGDRKYLAYYSINYNVGYAYKDAITGQIKKIPSQGTNNLIKIARTYYNQTDESYDLLTTPAEDSYFKFDLLNELKYAK